MSTALSSMCYFLQQGGQKPGHGESWRYFKILRAIYRKCRTEIHRKRSLHYLWSSLLHFVHKELNIGVLLTRIYLEKLQYLGNLRVW